MFISITRLRLRRWWYWPSFAILAQKSAKQARQAPGYRAGNVLADRKMTFWTMTAWDTEAAMKAYRGAGPHRTAMKKLPEWCDEASVAHWTAEELPSWEEAWERMQANGRFTPVKYPSELQKAKRIERPRTKPLRGGKI